MSIANKKLISKIKAKIKKIKVEVKIKYFYGFVLYTSTHKIILIAKRVKVNKFTKLLIRLLIINSQNY